MPSLDARISSLESVVPTEGGMTIWIHFISPGCLDRAIGKAWTDSKEWARADGETVEAFKHRVTAELDVNRGSFNVVFGE
jgi:hypothetical protein